jgi:hypothetical protein
MLSFHHYESSDSVISMVSEWSQISHIILEICNLHWYSQKETLCLLCWNIKLKTLTHELPKYNSFLVVVQEVRWNKGGSHPPTRWLYIFQ